MPGGYVGVDILGLLVIYNIWVATRGAGASGCEFVLKANRRVASAFLLMAPVTVPVSVLVLLPRTARTGQIRGVASLSIYSVYF